MSKHKPPILSPASEDELADDIMVVPEIEKDIPIPRTKQAAVPDMTTEREVLVRANTIKTVSDLSGDNIEPSKEHQEQAQELARDMMTNKKLRPEFATYPNETMAFLAGLVAQTNCMIVEELSDLKLYTVNKFVELSAMAEKDRDRISALRSLGEIDGVDAFKRKTEITHITKSGDELEKELLETIEQLRGTLVEGEVLETKIND
jgi:hypothetical protein|tara:strand:- start:104 stop:718 length:615 start_codon:yes stop_codon:yes gene_type:complete